MEKNKFKNGDNVIYFDLENNFMEVGTLSDIEENEAILNCCQGGTLSPVSLENEGIEKMYKLDDLVYKNVSGMYQHCLATGYLEEDQ
mgnify:FL=1